MNKKASLVLAATLALASPVDQAEARGARGLSIGKSVNKTLTAPKPVPKAPPKAPEAPATQKQQNFPPNTSAPGVVSKVGNATKATLDILAPRDDFMRNLYLIRAFSSGAQYLAFTPTTLDTIAGAQYKTMMEKAKTLPDTHPTHLRVKRITDRLVDAVRFDSRISPEIKQRMKWEIHVIASETINAFCLPGGKMAIYTGIIEKLQLTDDEIAVIMGHEITHALEDHGYKRLKESLALKGITAVAGATTGRYIGAFDLAGELWILSNSRDHEREADSGGLEIVRKAGYDVCAGEKVWEKMGKISKGAPPEILSTHPPSDERRDNLRRQAQKSGANC